MVYASNAPVSRPANTVSSPEADFGGICWDSKKGMVFKQVNEYLPIVKPVSRRKNG